MTTAAPAPRIVRHRWAPWRIALASALSGIAALLAAEAPSHPAPVTGGESPAVAMPAPDLPTIVYLPHADASVPLLQGGVVVPYATAADFWHALAALQAAPTATASISSYALDGAVANERALLQLSTTAIAIRDGWSALPLPDGLNLVSFSAADPRVSVGRAGDGLVLHLPAAGSYAIAATLAAPVEQQANGRRQIALTLLGAPAGDCTLDLGERASAVAIEPHAPFTAEELPGSTRVHVALGALTALTLSWQPPVASAGEPLIICQLRARETIVAHALDLVENVSVHVERRPLATLSFTIAAGEQVLSVSGADLATWSVSGTHLALQFSRPIEGDRELAIQLEQPVVPLAPGSEVSTMVALPTLDGATRTVGTLGIMGDAADAIGVALADQAGLTRIDPNVLGMPHASVAVAFDHPPAAIQQRLRRAAPELHAQVDELLRLGVDEDRLDLRVHLDVSRAGIYGCAMALPAGWDLIDATSSTVRIDDSRVAAGTAGGRQLVLSFVSPVLGSADLQIRLHGAGTIPPSPPQGSGAVDLGVTPLIEMSDAHVNAGLLAIVAPRRWAIASRERVAVAAEDLAAVQAGAWGDALAQLDAGEEIALAFRWRQAAVEIGAQTPPSLALEAHARAQEIDLRSEDAIVVAAGAVHEALSWHGDVRYSAAASIRFQAPSAWDDQLVLRGGGIADHTAITRDHGVTTWEVRFTEPVLGPFTVSLEHSQALAASASASGSGMAELTLPAVEVLGVTRRERMVAIAEDGDVAVEASAGTLTVIPPSDLPAALQGGNVVAAFHGTDAAPIGLRIHRRDEMRLADAAVRAARYSAVIGEDGHLRVVGILAIASHGRPTLELTLPAHARLLEVTVDHRPARPSQGARALLIALPSDARSEAIPVAFAYEIDDALVLHAGCGRLRVELPRLGEDTHAAPLPIEDVELSLFLPSELLPLLSRGDIQPLGAARGAAIAEQLVCGDGQDDSLAVRIAMTGERSDWLRLGGGGELRLAVLSRTMAWVLAIAAFLVSLSLSALLAGARRFSHVPALLMATAAAGACTADAPALVLVLAGLALGAALAVLRQLWRALLAWHLRRAPPPVAEPPSDDPWLMPEVPAPIGPGDGAAGGAAPPTPPAGGAS